MSSKFKHFSVISVSSLWVLFLLYILYIDGTFINGKPLIAERLSIATILGPFVLIYLVFNHHNRPKDKKQMSAMVARLLAIEEPPSDAADALAIAIAGVQSGKNFHAQKGSAPAGGGLQAAIAAALAKETL